MPTNLSNIIMSWKGQNNTYWCTMRYWIGCGYQTVEREISQTVYEQLNTFPA